MSSYDPSAVMSVRPRSWLEAWVAARIPSDEQRRAVWINEARVQGERAKAKSVAQQTNKQTNMCLFSDAMRKHGDCRV